MDINFDRKIISNTNRQYLVQDFLETRVSFHWIMLNHYKISDGFCLDTFYAILMYPDIVRKFLQKNDGISRV